MGADLSQPTVLAEAPAGLEEGTLALLLGTEGILECLDAEAFLELESLLGHGGKPKTVSSLPSLSCAEEVS